MKTTGIKKVLLTDTDLQVMGLGSAQTRRNKRCKGEDPIPYIRIGRLVRYHIVDVRSYIAQNRVERRGK
jgi:hypothetical protein